MFFEKKKKILLLIDNCPAHPKDVPLRNIELVYLPPNSTSKLQPLDQGIIKVVKQKYRKKLVQRHLKNMEAQLQDKNSTAVTILDAMHYIAAAWDAVEPKCIRNCFRKAKVGVEGEVDLDLLADEIADDPDLAPFPEYLNIDDAVVTSEARSLEQICDDQASTSTQDERESDEEDEPETPVPSLAAALDSLHTFRQYLSSLAGAEDQISQLNSLKTFTIQDSEKKARQSKLDEYFHF